MIFISNDYHLQSFLKKELTQAGDIIAKKGFREEIVKRIIQGYRSIIIYLVVQNYLFYLSKNEIENMIQSI